MTVLKGDIEKEQDASSQMCSTDRKTVCFVAPKAYPLFNPDAKNVKNPFGGAEVDLYLLAVELAKDRDFDVSFITADYGQGQIEAIRNVRVIKSLDFDQNPLAGAIKVWRAMRAADAQIYFHEAASIGTFLVALFSKLHGRVFIYRTAKQAECDGTYVKQHYFEGKAFLWSLRNSTQLVVQNKTDKEQIELTAPLSPTVIQNAHYLPRLTEGQRNIILWVGRSAPIKRPTMFLDLAEQAPDEKFVMVCPRAMDDPDYDQLLSRARTITNLEFIQQVPFHQISDFFQRAKVFVCTSEAEGFPNTYIEACKYGTPILTRRVNPDDFLSKYDCGVCANGNWDQFVSALKLMLEPDMTERYGRNARAYAEQNHNIETIIQEYKDMFSRLLSSA
jgi:glycosyltransferase involved in cell wall biosynthesis